MVQKLSEIINLEEMDICLSSPLKRARETANIITNNKLEIITDDLLVERDFGDYEGTKVTQELIDKNWDFSLNDSSNNMESLKDLLLRIKIFLDKIKKEYQNKNILIVSHGCFIKCLHFNIIGYNENTDFLSYFPKNTTLYKYEIE